MLRGLTDRIKYGSVVAEGDFQIHEDEYQEIICNFEDVDVEVREWYNPTPYTGKLFTPTHIKTSETSKENISGEEAWEFANSMLENITPEGGNIGDLPFSFEHRSRGAQNIVQMGVAGASPLGSRSEYYLSFEGSKF